MIVFGLAILISIASLVGYFMYYLGAGFEKRQQNVQYFCVSFGRYDTREEANQFAKNIRLRGGAGVIYGDKNEVLGSLYKSKEDANKVVAQNESYSMSILTFSLTDKYSMCWCIDELMDISVNFDKTDDATITSSKLQILKNRLAQAENKTKNVVAQDYARYAITLIDGATQSPSNYAFNIKYIAINALIRLVKMD